MALYDQSGVTEDLLNQVAITVNTHLKGRCKFCPRGFERGEKIVFATMKNVQMKWIEADIEKAEEAGFGEHHVVEVINAHLPCAITNAHQLRGATAPKGLV